MTATHPSAHRAAVLGSPITHSLSPVLHNAAYAALGLARWEYTARECGEADLAGVVDSLGPDWAGLSLTMPLKRVALEVADESSPAASAIGAANTLLFLRGRRRAENTDAPGMVDALREAGLGRGCAGRTGQAVVLGAGGTAQAGLAALRELTEEPVLVAVRDRGRAGELLDAAERLGVTVELTDLAEIARIIPDADLVLSTLPKGAANPLASAQWRSGTVVFDVVYDPWPTPLAAAAAAAGAAVVSGLDLLLHQACHQVRLMTGRPAPLAAMRAALGAAVDARR